MTPALPESGRLVPATVDAWRAAILAAGWIVTPTYSEPEAHAWTAKRDGWIILAINRPASERRRSPDCNVSAWAADGLAVKVPPVVDVAGLLAGADTCATCGAIGPTVRLGFAGRACPPCRVRLAPTVEHPGWCD